MFEKATRMKLRFEYRGLRTVEDLWDLRLEELDTIFKQLNAQSKILQEESLLSSENEEGEVLNLKISLIKHIVAVRLQERKKREEEAERDTKKQTILRIISEKQDESLRGMSIEELKELVE
jgi:hypothetical protein